MLYILQLVNTFDNSLHHAVPLLRISAEIHGVFRRFELQKNVINYWLSSVSVPKIVLSFESLGDICRELTLTYHCFLAVVMHNCLLVNGQVMSIQCRYFIWSAEVLCFITFIWKLLLHFYWNFSILLCRKFEVIESSLPFSSFVDRKWHSIRFESTSPLALTFFIGNFSFGFIDFRLAHWDRFLLLTARNCLNHSSFEGISVFIRLSSVFPFRQFCFLYFRLSWMRELQLQAVFAELSRGF